MSQWIELREGARIAAYDSLDSTNAEALRLAEAGESGPLWVTAAEQTVGRGRHGRVWVSPPGNLYVTLLLTHEGSGSALSQLAFVAGLAVHQACAKALGEGQAKALHLKWPNDLLLGRAKLAGLLLETGRGALPAPGPRTVAIGMGLNVAGNPEGGLYPATNLHAHGCEITSEALLHSLIRFHDDWSNTLKGEDGFKTVLEGWQGRAHPVGTPVSVKTPHGVIHGRFAGLDSTGAALIETDEGVEERILAGDLFIRSGEEGAG